MSDSLLMAVLLFVCLMTGLKPIGLMVRFGIPSKSGRQFYYQAMLAVVVVSSGLFSFFTTYGQGRTKEGPLQETFVFIDEGSLETIAVFDLIPGSSSRHLQLDILGKFVPDARDMPLTPMGWWFAAIELAVTNAYFEPLPFDVSQIQLVTASGEQMALSYSGFPETGLAGGFFIDAGETLTGTVYFMQGQVDERFHIKYSASGSLRFLE